MITLAVMLKMDSIDGDRYRKNRGRRLSLQSRGEMTVGQVSVVALTVVRSGQMHFKGRTASIC